MRERKVRGMDTNGQWHIGLLSLSVDGTFISNEYGMPWAYPIPVRPETIGDYTGLKDKNGKEIYEGDIIKNPIIGDLWIVEFKECAFYACLIGNDYETLLGPLVGFEVTGNIYETPELIK